MSVTWRLSLALGLSPLLIGQIGPDLPMPGAGAAEIVCDPAGSDQLVTRARTAIAGGDPAMAATLFRRAYEACPSRRPILLEAVQALAAKRDFTRAIETASEYLSEDSNSVQALLMLANIHFMAQHFKECLEVSEQVLKLEPGNNPAAKLKGNSVYFLGDAALAEQIFLQLLETHPEDEEAAYMLGRIYFQENRGDYAMAQFQRVLKMNPRSYKAHDNIALCYEAAGDTEMAIRHFLTAIKLVEKDHPEYDWPYANLADLLLRQDEAERAYQAATMAAKRNPYSARNFFLGGKALARLGRTEDAKKWLLRSTELDPTYPEPLYLLGQVYMKLGEGEKAKETLTKFREAKANAPRKRM